MELELAFVFSDIAANLVARTKNKSDTAQRGQYDPDRTYRLRERVNDGLAHDRILVTNEWSNSLRWHGCRPVESAHRNILQV